MSTGGKFALVILGLVVVFVGFAILNATKATASTTTTSGGTTNTSTGSLWDTITGAFKKKGNSTSTSSDTIQCYDAAGNKSATGTYDQDGFPSPDCGFGA